MASTRGRKQLPIPQSIIDGFDSMGLVEMPRDDPDEPRTWRLPRHPSIAVTLVASNVPGSTTVTAKRPGHRAEYLTADEVIVSIAIDIAQADSPTRKVHA